MAKQQFDVFISYSSKNKGVAKSIADALEPDIPCWYAPRDIPTGSDWAGSIDEAIESCSVFLLVLTPESNDSRQVPKEVSLADAAHKPILVVRAGEFELAAALSYHLASTQWLVADELEDVDRNAVRETTAKILSRPVTVKRLSQGLGGGRIKKLLSAGAIFVAACLLLLAASSFWSGDDQTSGGKQTAPMTLEFVDEPQPIDLGDTAEFRFLVENKGSAIAEEVKVMLTLPDALVDAGQNRRNYSETIDLAPSESRELAMTVLAAAGGRHALSAVVFQGGREVRKTETVLEFEVLSPSMSYEVTLPEWTLGNQGRLQVTLRNSGTAPAKGMVMSADLPPGVLAPDGNQSLKVEFGDLPAGQERTSQAMLTSVKAVKAPFEIRFEGSNAPNFEKMVTAQVIESKLDLKISGPTRVYPGKNIQTTVTITNPGTVDVDNVAFTMTPKGPVNFVSMDHGGRFQGDRTIVRLGKIRAGRELVFNVNWRAQSNAELEFHASLQGALLAEIKETHRTTVAGIPALKLEVTDTKDPIKTGDEAEYVITVTNMGSAPEKDLKFDITLPLNLSFVSASPKPSRQDPGQLHFSLAALAPGGQERVCIKCKATDRGIAQLEVVMTASSEFRQEQFEQTGVDMISPIKVEVTPLEDPILAGENVTYKVRLTNQAAQAYRKIRCRFTLPNELRCVSAQGASPVTRSERTAAFEVDRLDPGSLVTYLIVAKALKAGSVSCRLTYQCAEIPLGFHRSVNTVIYE
jgi:uncharacterized repeat protein (TIGR01451 family)